jgi:hypothetical protein
MVVGVGATRTCPEVEPPAFLDANALANFAIRHKKTRKLIKIRFRFSLTFVMLSQAGESQSVISNKAMRDTSAELLWTCGGNPARESGALHSVSRQISD